MVQKNSQTNTPNSHLIQMLLTFGYDVKSHEVPIYDAHVMMRVYYFQIILPLVKHYLNE